VSVWVCVYIYIYVYIYVYMYIYKCTYICIYIYILILHICIYMYKYICMYMYIFQYKYMHMGLMAPLNCGTRCVFLIYIGKLRLVCWSKWQVSFAKEPYKRDDVLQTSPTILRSLLFVATQYLSWMCPWIECCKYNVHDILQRHYYDVPEITERGVYSEIVSWKCSLI